MTDEEILALITTPGQQEDGFRHLVRRYQQKLYHVIRRQVSSHENADDILQDTFIKVFRHIGSFENRSGLFTWMYRIACNEVINFQKQHLKVKHEEMKEKMEISHTDTIIDVDEVKRSLESAINKLPERQQMVFRMRYYDELSYKQMSELLDLTEGALKASFHHAVRKLEAEIRSQQIF